MALSLNQINDKRKTSPTGTLHPEKGHVARPWETFDKLGNQTRTVAAREAVDRARMIAPTAPLFIERESKKIIEPARKIKTDIKAGGMVDFLSFLF